MKKEKTFRDGKRRRKIQKVGPVQSMELNVVKVDDETNDEKIKPSGSQRLDYQLKLAIHRPISYNSICTEVELNNESLENTETISQTFVIQNHTLQSDYELKNLAAKAGIQHEESNQNKLKIEVFVTDEKGQAQVLIEGEQARKKEAYATKSKACAIF